METNEVWITRTFGDLPIGATFWVVEYECSKVSETQGEFSGELFELSLEDEVWTLILG